MTPPAAFSSFWQEMTACTGLSRDVSGIRWYKAVMLGDPKTGSVFDGEYHHPDIIVLRASVWESRHAPTVLHEMIHALDAERGVWEHSYPTGTNEGLVYTPSFDAWHDCTRHYDRDFANQRGW